METSSSNFAWSSAIIFAGDFLPIVLILLELLYLFHHCGKASDLHNYATSATPSSYLCDSILLFMISQSNKRMEIMLHLLIDAEGMGQNLRQELIRAKNV